MIRPITVAAAIASAAILAPSRATAEPDPPELQRMRVVERGDLLHATASISKLFDRSAYEALSSGFSSTVVVRIWVFPRDSTEPVAFRLLHRDVLYNLWDDVYELKLDGPGGRRVVRVQRKSEAFKLLTEIVDLPVARLVDLPVGRVFLLAMEVELNPVSKETLAEVRRWLTQGTGGGLDRGGSFFGSFVSVFVNPKIAEADRVLRIQSQPFYRPRS